MEGFEAKVGKTVEEYHMLEPGDRVIAAVSGGADSVCLLALLAKMRERLHLGLRAVHVHHGLRGAEADRDGEFVQELCSGLDVPCHIIKVDVRGLAGEKGLCEEEAGRRLRYEAFEAEAAAWEAEDPEGCRSPVRVAVAHHRGDQAETILHNLFRGSGLLGLRGIPYVRGRIIRPLLDGERREILDWLKEMGLSFMEDSTNKGVHYTRNRIRMLLPRIENEVNRGAVGNILRLGRLAGQADAYLKAQADLWIKDYVRRENCDGAADAFAGDNKGNPTGNPTAVFIPGESFLEQPEIIGSYIVMELLKELSGQARDLGERHVQQVMELAERPVGKTVDLPYGLMAQREYDGIRVGFPSFWEGRQKAPLPGLEFETFSYEIGMDFPKKMYTKWFDCDKIEGTPVVRNRKAGDYITLADGSRKTVKRFMIDEKIPRQMRDEIPLLADGSHVIWIIGYRISRFYRIGPDTKRVLGVKVTGRAD